MANDPAFLFYPGDYLRDTQCLSEKAQVSYDRIMCEHMRNICVTQAQLNFFTKRLSDEEKAELLFVLEEIDGGYTIGWLRESIEKRKSYSESRRVNRLKKPQETYDNICEHMENENEDVNKYSKLFIEFISLINKYTGKNFKGDSPSKRQFRARIKEGRTMDEFETAIKNFVSDSYHIQENLRFITPEFITRSDKLEKGVNMGTVKPSFPVAR